MSCVHPRRLIAVCLTAILLLSVFLLSGCTVTAEPSLTVTFYKIGKADAALLSVTGEGGTHSVLIDTGESDDAPELIDKLRDAGVETLDCLILSHFDKDHIGGFPSVIAEIPAERILLPDYEGTGEPYEAMRETLAQCSGAEILTEDVTFTLGDAQFTVSVPQCAEYEKKQDNNSSLAVTVTYGQNIMLFAGDAEAERQEELIGTMPGSVTLLKVPHHGVWNKGLDTFFAATSPVYAVITDSDKNPAEQKTLDALNTLGTRIYETRNGDIRAVFTQTTVTVTQ